MKKLLLGLALLLLLLWLAGRWLLPPPAPARPPVAVLVVHKPARAALPKHVSAVTR